MCNFCTQHNNHWNLFCTGFIAKLMIYVCWTFLCGNQGLRKLDCSNKTISSLLCSLSGNLQKHGPLTEAGKYEKLWYDVECSKCIPSLILNIHESKPSTISLKYTWYWKRRNNYHEWYNVTWYPVYGSKYEFSYFQREEEDGWGLGREMSHQAYIVSITIAYIGMMCFL